MINVAILGLGVVGKGVYDAIKVNQKKLSSFLGDEIKVKYVLDKRTFDDPEIQSIVVNDINVITNDKEISVVAETMGGEHPAYDFSLACIQSGKSVVTSNKLVVEKRGSELEEAAKKAGVSYLYEASVGGGIPVIHPLMNCFAANDVSCIRGILNGTTNYILERMENASLSFEEALKEAQKLGYAEADPTADIEGFDAARKICILASIAFGSWYHLDDCAEITGISDITPEQIKKASEMGMKIKLLGCAENKNGKVVLYVRPCLVPKSMLLSSVNGVFNCITVTGNFVGEVAFYGQGAGSHATASAVVSDIAECIKTRPQPVIKSDSLSEKSLCFGHTEEINGKIFPVL